MGIAQKKKKPKILVVETWLVTRKRSHWLHEGHVVWRHTFILKPTCGAVSLIHSHFPTLRKVAQ